MFAPFTHAPSEANKAAPTGNLEYGLYEPFLAETDRKRVNECAMTQKTAFTVKSCYDEILSLIAG
jgi:hypothetical protein